jgi:hypothetical protein
MGRRAIITGLICAAPLVAVAAALPISGSYGNELGCQLARTGEYNPVEGVELLTPTELSTAVMLCSFDAVKTAPNNGHHVSMTCAQEGSGPEDNTREQVEISGNPASGYVVDFADGTSWGPLNRC